MKISMRRSRKASKTSKTSSSDTVKTNTFKGLPGGGPFFVGGVWEGLTSASDVWGLTSVSDAMGLASVSDAK